MKGPPFPDQQPTQPDAIESVVADHLWRWVFLPRDDRTKLLPFLSGAVEYYLCAAFDLIEFTRSRGTWCDGILELSVKQINRRTFLLTGVGYFPDSLAPFEIEFHFPHRRDRVAQLTVIRFGEHDGCGEMRVRSNEEYAGAILAARPRGDSDWAVVAELTPLAEGNEEYEI